ncbi:NADH-ubiquinone oxidoreductase 14.8 kDa subunit [Peziza echinospora]|nr:NADH-ubiquinone oxidoreductase 14.8 kDa subunit [Peziza echinospora]
MTISPTLLAKTARSSLNAADARKRVLHSYREWLRSAPQILNLYVLDLPVSTVRSKIRQEFERHRYVKQLPVIDVLLAQSHREFQETLNYWKQVNHVMKYFQEEQDDPVAKVSGSGFMQGFLEGRS